MVTPSYEVGLVHIKTPKKKIRTRKKKKAKIIKKKFKPKPKKITPKEIKKEAKPVVEDEIKIAVPKKPPPPKAPPPPRKEPPPPTPKPVSKITRDDGAASQMTVESTQFPYQYYVNIIHGKIMNNWFPENDYVKPESEVTILIYFRVRKSGEITGLKLVSGSGEDILNRSAIAAIVNSKPFPRLPDGFVDDYLGVNFRFILHGVQWE